MVSTKKKIKLRDGNRKKEENLLMLTNIIVAEDNLELFLLKINSECFISFVSSLLIFQMLKREFLDVNKSHVRKYIDAEFNNLAD